MALPELTQRYQVRWIVHLVPAPDRSAAPDPQRLQHWSALDAQRLARIWQLDAPDFSSHPSERQIQSVQSELARMLDGLYDMSEVLAMSDALWRGNTLNQTTADQPRTQAWREQALARGQVNPRADRGDYIYYAN